MARKFPWKTAIVLTFAGTAYLNAEYKESHNGEGIFGDRDRQSGQESGEKARAMGGVVMNCTGKFKENPVTVEPGDTMGSLIANHVVLKAVYGLPWGEGADPTLAVDFVEPARPQDPNPAGVIVPGNQFNFPATCTATPPGN